MENNLWYLLALMVFVCPSFVLGVTINVSDVYTPTTANTSYVASASMVGLQSANVSSSSLVLKAFGQSPVIFTAINHDAYDNYSKYYFRSNNVFVKDSTDVVVDFQNFSARDPLSYGSVFFSNLSFSIPCLTGSCFGYWNLSDAPNALWGNRNFYLGLNVSNIELYNGTKINENADVSIVNYSGGCIYLGYNCTWMNDGNWSSRANAGTGIYYILYANYSKPKDAIRTGTKWLLKMKPSINNLSLNIPISCWSLNPLQLKVAVGGSTTPYDRQQLYCKNNDGWLHIYDSNKNDSNYYYALTFYEERMNWHIINTSAYVNSSIQVRQGASWVDLVGVSCANSLGSALCSSDSADVVVVPSAITKVLNHSYPVSFLYDYADRKIEVSSSSGRAVVVSGLDAVKGRYGKYNIYRNGVIVDEGVSDSSYVVSGTGSYSLVANDHSAFEVMNYMRDNVLLVVGFIGIILTVLVAAVCMFLFGYGTVGLNDFKVIVVALVLVCILLGVAILLFSWIGQI